jgi:hypothetical protein
LNSRNNPIDGYHQSNKFGRGDKVFKQDTNFPKIILQQYKSHEFATTNTCLSPLDRRAMSMTPERLKFPQDNSPVRELNFTTPVGSLGTSQEVKQ